MQQLNSIIQERKKNPVYWNVEAHKSNFQYNIKTKLSLKFYTENITRLGGSVQEVVKSFSDLTTSCNEPSN